MAEIIKGADVASDIKKELNLLIEKNLLKPCLAVVRAGEDESSIAYLRGIKKTCGSLGIDVKEIVFPENISQSDLENGFREIDSDKNIDGILLLRPLPKGLDDKPLTQIISPEKDVDCMSPANWAKLAMGDKDGFYPCTAEAVIRICDYAGIDLNGKRAVVIGRSQVIGRPVGLMLLARNATITWCHSRTRDLAAMCRDAEILVSACGVAELIDESIAEGIAPGCAVIDVGVNFKDGKMCGDFDFEAVSKYAGIITPVPGGTGAVTNTVLASHVVRAALRKSTSGLLLS